MAMLFYFLYRCSKCYSTLYSHRPSPSVRLSLGLSHASIVAKRIQLRSCGHRVSFRWSQVKSSRWGI